MADELDVVLRDFRQKVCDCIVVIPAADGSLQIATPCLKSSREMLRLHLADAAAHFQLSDGGQIQRQLELFANADIRLRTEQRLDQEAVQFGVERQGIERRVTFASAEAGDALSRLLQYLSHCETPLGTNRTQQQPIRTREQVLDLLAHLFGARASELIDIGAPADCRSQGLRPIRIQSAPPWDVLVIETDVDAKHAIEYCAERASHRQLRKILAIYENQLRINRKLVARLSDDVDKQFSSIQDTQRILAFLETISRAPE